MTDWQTLTDALARTIAALPDNGVLTLVEVARPDEGRAIHVARRSTVFRARAARHTPLADDPLEISADALAANGWAAPDDRHPLHWWLDLPFTPPVDPALATSLAARIVGAFYYGYGVRSPDELAYLAWQDGGPEKITYPDFPLPATDVRYWARTAAGDTPGDPSVLLRRIQFGERVVEQSYRRQQPRWQPSTTAPPPTRPDEPVQGPAAMHLISQWRTSAATPPPHTDGTRANDTPTLRRPTALAGQRDAEGNLIVPPRLADDERARVIEFLRGAPTLAVVFGSGRDPYQPSLGEVVPLHVRTDGEWAWSESLAYYAQRYGFAPDPEFLAHVRARGYRWPDLSEEKRVELADRLLAETQNPRP